ncbi:unnamed protein product [Peniophora sp. CBMAI 1063]|nr:unnamed protein product [Peniophora sp. CBMAI 1063]
MPSYHLIEPLWHAHCREIFRARDRHEDIRTVPLPHIFQLFETACRENFWGSKVWVTFVGRSVGVTDKYGTAFEAVVGYSGQHQLKARTIQQAHTLWYHWIGHIADVHEEHPTLSTAEVLKVARLRLPLRDAVKDIVPILPELPGIEVVVDEDTDSTASTISFMAPLPPAQEPRAT